MVKKSNLSLHDEWSDTIDHTYTGSILVALLLEDFYHV